MARTAKPRDARDDDPVALDEPDGAEDEVADARGENPWLRGLWMLIFAVLIYVAQGILALAALLQFFWLLFKEEKNLPIAEFGAGLARWLAAAARFQTADSEDKPFPFRRWGE